MDPPYICVGRVGTSRAVGSSDLIMNTKLDHNLTLINLPGKSDASGKTRTHDSALSCDRFIRSMMEIVG